MRERVQTRIRPPAWLAGCLAALLAAAQGVAFADQPAASLGGGDPAQLPAAGAALVQQDVPVTLELRNADLIDTLTALAKLGGVNVVADRSVSGAVTVRLDRVPLRQAVELIVKCAGQACRWDGNVVVVAPPDRLLEVGADRVEVCTYQLRHARSADVRAALSLVVPATQVQTTREDRQLVVRGSPAQQEAARELVAKLDTPLSQFSIEARIEEVYDGSLRELGLDWDVPLAIRLEGAGIDLSATLAALEEKGGAMLLAHPRVAVIDGQEATIHIGDRLPITVERQVTENGSTHSVATVEYINTGILLKVGLRDHGSGLVTVSVSPEVSTINGQTAEGHPQLRTRSASTSMTLRDGDTVALGGLIQEDEVRAVTQLPILGDVPVLGKLFQTSKVTRRKSEIVIFLTVRSLPIGE